MLPVACLVQGILRPTDCHCRLCAKSASCLRKENNQRFEADIANFRQQFHSQSASNYLDTDFETEEECACNGWIPCFTRSSALDDEHARSLEEEWIDSLDSAGTASLSQNSSSNNPAFLQGVLLGFFFPLLPFFFFRNSHPPPVFWEDGSPYEPTGNVIFS